MCKYKPQSSPYYTLISESVSSALQACCHGDKPPCAAAPMKDQCKESAAVNRALHTSVEGQEAGVN